MEKEIEILDFVIKEQNKRNIERGIVNSNQVDTFNNSVLGQVELMKRKKSNEIFHELDEKNKQYEESIKTNSKFKKFIGGALLLSTISISLYAGAKYENRPVRVVVKEMASDSNLFMTDNGKKSIGTMTPEELVQYSIENKLTIEQIEKEIEKFCKQEMLNKDFAQEKMEETNPGVFRRF